VRAHHAGVWSGDELVPDALRQMLDASITELTGLNDAHEAWAALFAPDERIAIKVNALRGPCLTHVPLVMAVTACLQAAGVPAEQIVIFDRYTDDLSMPATRSTTMVLERAATAPTIRARPRALPLPGTTITWPVGRS
jgi:hypothetical protein